MKVEEKKGEADQKLEGDDEVATECSFCKTHAYRES